MENVIIFQPENMPVAIMRPGDCGLPIKRIGQKDVPVGLPFWIVPASDIPDDGPLRMAWDIDKASLGEPSGVGDLLAFIAWYEEIQSATVAEGEVS